MQMFGLSECQTYCCLLDHLQRSNSTSCNSLVLQDLQLCVACMLLDLRPRVSGRSYTGSRLLCSASRVSTTAVSSHLPDQKRQPSGTFSLWPCDFKMSRDKQVESVEPGKQGQFFILPHPDPPPPTSILFLWLKAHVPPPKVTDCVPICPPDCPCQPSGVGCGMRPSPPSVGSRAASSSTLAASSGGTAPWRGHWRWRGAPCRRLPAPGTSFRPTAAERMPPSAQSAVSASVCAVCCISTPRLGSLYCHSVFLPD